jgi:cytoskeletal protein CcmA (bactofilin family)
LNDTEYPTVIGPDAKFKGELAFEKSVRVLGQFEGQISTKGTLQIANGAMVQADVEAGNVTVEGEIKGNMAASDLIELKDSAKIQGDIRCERLVVTEGASFVGHCHVGNGAAKSSEQGNDQQ